MNKESETFWLKEFKKEHFPCSKEWWCSEGFINSINDDEKWTFKAGLYQAIGKDKSIWSVYSMTLFDLKNHKSYSCNFSNDTTKLETKKDGSYIKYDKSYIKGLFPKYNMYFLDPTHNINLDLEYHSESKPYFIAQNITEGWLPWGLGYYRYGFVPKNNIKGTINIENKKISIKGKGYLEHIWGDFSFFYLSSSKRSIKKTISTYIKLFGHWLHNQKIKIPRSIKFSTDNRPPGYDWAWAVLDNGWSLFFGNMVFWITEGPGTGFLILSKDGISYNEFYNIHFKYNELKNIQKYDFFYPIELEVIASNSNEKLYLKFKSISTTVEDLTEATDETGLYGFVICEVPCEVTGYYLNGNKKTCIRGLSKIEHHRLLRTNGHNSLKLKLNYSKNNFGIISNFNSHYLGKKMDINLHFLPKPNFKINFNRINNYKKEKKE